MFSNEILLKIFEQKETQEVPIIYQSIMIHAVEKVLEEEENANKF